MASPTAKKQKTTHEGAVLYSYWRSSCSWRVRMALEWKGVAFETKPVHLLQQGGEHFMEEYSKLNPNQRLPTLVIDGHVLSQSGAILEYLEETRPEKSLLPTDSYQRARVRNVCGIIGADIQPIQNLAVMTKVTESLPAEEKGAKKVEWAHYWIDRGFVGLEQELKLTAGTYCVGDDVTLADVYLVPQVYNAHRFNVDMSKFPTIARVAKELEQVAAFEKAHPSQQPDVQ
ncbi:Maleylacetoacetate isomerase [Globisporangium polare]